MKRQLLIKIPKIEEILLFYFFTMSIWRDLFFSRISIGWIVNLVVLFGMIALATIKQSGRKYFLDIFILYLVICLLFVFKFWENQEMKEWITRSYGVVTMISWGGIFGYYVIRLQKSFNRMISVIKKTGIVLFVYYAWKSLEVLRNGYWTYNNFGEVRHSTYNMSWSYGILMAICFISIYLLKDKKKIAIVPIVVGTVGILVYGSRGTLIGLVIGIVLLVLLFNKEKMTWKNYLFSFLIAVFFIFFLSDSGLLLVSSLLKNAGLNSRFIDSLVGFSFSNFEETSNGRWAIWTKVIDLIKSGPFYGYGVYGERNAVYGIGMKWGYSHEIFLEIMVSFGWLFGSIIIIIAVVGIIRFFRDSKIAEEKLLFILFLTIGSELLLSNTLWLHCAPWVLMGLYANHFKHSYVE